MLNRRSYPGANELFQEIISDHHYRLMTDKNPMDLKQALTLHKIALVKRMWDVVCKEELNNKPEMKKHLEISYNEMLMKTIPEPCPTKNIPLENGYWEYEFIINNEAEREILDELRYAPFQEIKFIPLMEVNYKIDQNNQCSHFLSESSSSYETAEKLRKIFPLDYRAKLLYDLIVTLLKKETELSGIPDELFSAKLIFSINMWISNGKPGFGCYQFLNEICNRFAPGDFYQANRLREEQNTSPSTPPTYTLSPFHFHFLSLTAQGHDKPDFVLGTQYYLHISPPLRHAFSEIQYQYLLELKKHFKPQIEYLVVNSSSLFKSVTPVQQETTLTDAELYQRIVDRINMFKPSDFPAKSYNFHNYRLNDLTPEQLDKDYEIKCLWFFRAHDKSFYITPVMFDQFYNEPMCTLSFNLAAVTKIIMMYRNILREYEKSSDKIKQFLCRSNPFALPNTNEYRYSLTFTPEALNILLKHERLIENTASLKLTNSS